MDTVQFWFKPGVLKRRTVVHNPDRQDASGGPRLASVKVKNSTIKMPKLYLLTIVSLFIISGLFVYVVLVNAFCRLEFTSCNLIGHNPNYGIKLQAHEDRS